MAFFSTSSADYVNQIKALTKPTYTSKYGTLIEENLNKILNKKDFSYDFNADPLYQQYKDYYSKEGKEAAINASAEAAGLTSGFANSYAATSAAKANQNVLSQLNERIPELYNAAQTTYQNQLSNLYNKFNTLVSEENRLYNQYRDRVSDYYSDWGNLQNGYETAKAQENWEAEMEWKRQRAAVEDAQAAANLAYQQERAAVADSQWQQQYQAAISQAQAKVSTATPAATTAARTTSAKTSTPAKAATTTKVTYNTTINPSTKNKTIKQYTK